ncbi:hypothetical protein T439DRAFT_322280, partial [Meredithblackwellia eburnea MCA 4105]
MSLRRPKHTNGEKPNQAKKKLTSSPLSLLAFKTRKQITLIFLLVTSFFLNEVRGTRYEGSGRSSKTSLGNGTADKSAEGGEVALVQYGNSNTPSLKRKSPVPVIQLWEARPEHGSDGMGREGEHFDEAEDVLLISNPTTALTTNYPSFLSYPRLSIIPLVHSSFLESETCQLGVKEKKKCQRSMLLSQPSALTPNRPKSSTTKRAQVLS